MRNYFIAAAFLVPAATSAQETPSNGVRSSVVSVQSSTLQDVGPWGAGALPDGLAPLASDLWRNSDPGTLGLLFARISPDQRFPSLQSLTRQAIFSGGTAPTTDSDITRSRFEAANRFGPAEATARLVFGIPRLASDVGLATIAIDAGLRVGRVEEACNLIEAVTAPPQGTVWLEARAACYALNDEGGAANLSVDLAKSRGLTDTWLSRAIAAVGGPLSAPPPFRVDSGRAVALSLRAKLKPPIALAASQDPIALSALIGNGEFMASLPPNERLAILRNAAGRGVVSPHQLASLTPVSEVVLDPAVTPLTVPAGITQRMLAAPTLALRALEGRLALADIKTVMETQPGLMTLADVPILTEAALWSGDGVLASLIASLAPAAMDARLALVIALYDPSKESQSVATRIDAASADPVSRRIATRDALIAWSAGISAGSGLSSLVQNGLPWGPAGNAGLRAALDLAASRSAKGEVILLAALALQGTEPATIDPETLIAAVKALRRVGLPDAARDVARDYLLATLVTLPARQPARARTATASAPAISSSPRAQVAQEPAKPNVTAQQGAPSQATRPPITRPVVRAPIVAAPAPSLAPMPSPLTARSKPSWGTP